jgi:hypothetical protein
MFKGPITGFFGVLRETTSRQLPFGQMIGDAIAADSLPAAGLERAVACFQVIFLFAFHRFTGKRFTHNVFSKPDSYVDEIRSYRRTGNLRVLDYGV